MHWSISGYGPLAAGYEKQHCNLLLMLLYFFSQNFVLKKMLTKRKVDSHLYKVEVKLILLSCIYILLEIMIVAHFTHFYNNRIIINNDITEYFICESTGESDCQQYLNEYTTYAILLRLILTVWSIIPFMILLLKANVFKHIKNCFQITCSKK